jgi:xanthine/uracil permease
VRPGGRRFALYVVLSLCIKAFGAGFLHKLLPPVVVGPVIMVIGLVLAPVAVHMAMGRTGDGSAWLVPQSTAMIVAAYRIDWSPSSPPCWEKAGFA